MAWGGVDRDQLNTLSGRHAIAVIVMEAYGIAARQLMQVMAAVPANLPA
jgi:hypothetical protein